MFSRNRCDAGTGRMKSLRMTFPSILHGLPLVTLRGLGPLSGTATDNACAWVTKGQKGGRELHRAGAEEASSGVAAYYARKGHKANVD